MEDKMKNIFLIIILSLILFSCGEKEEAEEETTTELEGTWKAMRASLHYSQLLV